jgi:branched-chain amino acid transport system ATP-binding protein
MSEAGGTTPILEVKSLEAGYHGSIVLADISLTLGQDEIVAVVGSNGAGKSTLLGTLSGLVKVRRGTVTVAGEDFSHAAPHQFVRAGVVHVPEGRQVFPSMSVDENLTMGAFTRRRDTKALAERKDSVLSVFPRLQERRTQNAASLSGGEQQMLAIARGLMAKPKLLMLDEPSWGIAPKLVTRILDTIQLINSTGITLLLVEQNVQRALAIAHRGYVMQTGRIVIEGASRDLLGSAVVQKAYLGM